MALSLLTFIVLLLGCVLAAPSNEGVDVKAVPPHEMDREKNDLKTAASHTSTRRFADYSNYPNTYSSGATGYGVLDYGRYNYYGIGSYDTTPYLGNVYGSGYVDTGIGSGGYAGYGNGYTSNYYAAYGGYGGSGGNGGINSYYGYNSPGYQGNQHLGYGYYNRRPGYGSIYQTGITPNLVTGYRGYSKK